MQEFIVGRDGMKDLRFTGEMLANVSNRWLAGREQTRWTEITAYKTESGKYVIAWEFITLWQGEMNTCKATVCGMVSEVVAELMDNDSNGEAYFSDLSKKLLNELAQSDNSFKELLYDEI